ncbi:hypothetical protein IW150_004482 [Coemansia sp. RSA 2607]|nr:hypothetical protein IW150_004482 [Coemansia sp. RSA 2607]
MRPSFLPVLLFASYAAAIWTFPQKIGIYSMVQKLATYKLSSADESMVYGRLAIFYDDWIASAKLSSPVDSSQYRDGLFALLAHINAARSEAISDPAGVENLEYLVTRIRNSYADSVQKFFGH